MKLGVINYGMGNLGSVITAVKNLGFQAEITSGHVKKGLKLICPNYELAPSDIQLMGTR